MRPNVTLLFFATENAIADRSERDPDMLFVALRTRYIARGGCVISAHPMVVKLLLAVAARPGTVISSSEMIELLWGDRSDGGPNSAEDFLRQLWRDAHIAFIALGYVATSEYGRGYSARPLGRREDLVQTGVAA